MLATRKIEQKIDTNSRKLDLLCVGVGNLRALVTDGFQNLHATMNVDNSPPGQIREQSENLHSVKHKDITTHNDITDSVDAEYVPTSPAVSSSETSKRPPSLDDCSWGESSKVRNLVIRLLPDMHLKESLMEFCVKRDIKAACILTCVGSLRKANLRLANGTTVS